jgi:hypothetical protein
MTLNEEIAAPNQSELAEADSLISDLATLVDAGLVVVHEHVLGPVRYGVARRASARSKLRPARPGRIPQSPSFSDEHRPGVGVGSPP